MQAACRGIWDGDIERGLDILASRTPPSRTFSGRSFVARGAASICATLLHALYRKVRLNEEAPSDMVVATGQSASRYVEVDYALLSHSRMHPNSSSVCRKMNQCV
jgi:hypothetical protein